MDKVGTIEMVTFKTKDGVLVSEARQKLESLNDCVKQYDGFLGRKLSRDNAGEWLDLVYWKDLASATKAAELIMQNTVALEAFIVIDESTMKMRHYEVKSQFLTNN